MKRFSMILLTLLVILLAGNLCFLLTRSPKAPASTAPVTHPLETTVPDDPLPSLEQLLGKDYASLLQKEILQQMRRRMDLEPLPAYFPITQGKPLEIGPQTQYTLDSSNTLIIHFPAGSVADQAYGPQRFQIPKGLGPFVPSSQWNLVLVNPWHPIAPGYTVELTQLRNGQSFDSRAYPELQQMMDDARAAGLSPLICSSYRTDAQQQNLYRNKVQSLLNQGYTKQAAEAEAGRWVAVPGTSEHQLGLAVDIIASSYQVLDEAQENTAEQQWLMANAHRYGFILRYPSEKSAITSIGYEPWHYRYVGKAAAKEIFEQGLCLEEYLQQLANR